MDDFLYNLRRETDKRNRRQQGGQQQYRGPDRRGMKDQRRNFPRRNDASEQLAELLPEIKSLLETLNENQKKLVATEKRKTMTLENIAASLRMMSGNDQAIEAVAEEIAPVDPVEAQSEESDTAEAISESQPDEESFEPDTESIKPDAEDSQEELPRSNREDIRKIALELREKGKTYKEIAQYLDDENIPTFSGKGGWHAPTIHKLCK